MAILKQTPVLPKERAPSFVFICKELNSVSDFADHSSPSLVATELLTSALGCESSHRKGCAVLQ